MYCTLQSQIAATPYFSCEPLHGHYCFHFTEQYSQQTRGVDHVLVQCWFIVCDAGPTLNQHMVNSPCLLGEWWTRSRYNDIIVCSFDPVQFTSEQHKTPVKCLICSSAPDFPFIWQTIKRQNWTVVVITLAQRMNNMNSRQACEAGINRTIRRETNVKVGSAMSVDGGGGATIHVVEGGVC